MESSFNANFSLCFCFLDFCVVAEKLDRCKSVRIFAAARHQRRLIYEWVLYTVGL